MNNLADAINSKAGTSGKKSMDELIDIVNNITSGSGSTINGTVKQYKILSGETINAGDFVEYVNGFTSQLSTSARSGLYSSCVLLEDNKVFIAYSDTGYYYLMGAIVTIEDNTFTVTTTKLINDNYGCMCSPSCILLEDNKVLIIHSCGASYYYLYAALVEIDGSNMTVSSRSMLSSNEKSCYTNPCAILIGDNKVFVAHSYSSNTQLGSE